MTFTLYVSNIPLSVTEAEIYTVFVDYGDVEQVERLVNQRTSEPREAMKIVMVDDQAAITTINELNGYLLNDQPIFISPEQVMRITSDEALTAAIEEINSVLQETAKGAMRQLRQIVEFGGAAFARALLAETQRVEAAGGLMTNKKERRRTIGGVYFYLSKKHLSSRVQRPIFYVEPVKKKKKEEQQTEQAAPKPKKQKAETAAEKPAPKAKKQTKKQPAEAAQPVPSVTELRASEPAQAAPAELTPDVQEQYKALQNAYQQAKSNLEDIQSRPASEQTGLFTATKEVWKLESQLRDMQSRYPELA